MNGFASASGSCLRSTENRFTRACEVKLNLLTQALALALALANPFSVHVTCGGKTLTPGNPRSTFSVPAGAYTTMNRSGSVPLFMVE